MFIDDKSKCFEFIFRGDYYIIMFKYSCMNNNILLCLLYQETNVYKYTNFVLLHNMFIFNSSEISIIAIGYKIFYNKISWMIFRVSTNDKRLVSSHLNYDNWSVSYLSEHINSTNDHFRTYYGLMTYYDQWLYVLQNIILNIIS